MAPWWLSLRTLDNPTRTKPIWKVKLFTTLFKEENHVKLTPKIPMKILFFYLPTFPLLLNFIYAVRSCLLCGYFTDPLRLKQRIGKLTPQQAKTKQGNKVECFGLKIPASIYLLETTTKHSHFEDFEEYDTTHITGRVFKCPGGGGAVRILGVWNFRFRSFLGRKVWQLFYWVLWFKLGYLKQFEDSW